MILSSDLSFKNYDQRLLNAMKVFFVEKKKRYLIKNSHQKRGAKR